MSDKPRWFLIYTENFAHCFICRGRLMSHVCAFLAGMASHVEFNPQRVIVAGFDSEPECDPVTTAKAFHRYGYFSDDRPWNC